MNIFIVIPTHNRCERLQNVILHISKLLLPDNVTLNLCVVLAGSTDGTLEMIKQKYPEINVVYGKTSWWYTKCMNEGFKFVKQFEPEYILTLNDDVEFESDYLLNLIKALNTVGQDSIINSISIKNKFPNEVIFSGVFKINKWLRKYYHYIKPFSSISINELKGVHPTMIISGRGILIPFHILQELNYFDERFPQYGSDDDFGLRAIKKGYEIYISWDARIFEDITLTSKGTPFNKPSFKEFFFSFFNKYSINSLKKTAIYSWRHGYKLLFPFYILFTIAGTFKAYFFKYSTK